MGAPAMATGLKRVLPDRVVFTYQGDGDLASIGLAEILHAAARGENISLIFINNAVYGMTGGQMAPTSLPGMRTTSSPACRDVHLMGHPIKICALLAQIDGAAYVVRRGLHRPGEIRKAKKAIRQAFENQIDGVGFSLVALNNPSVGKYEPLLAPGGNLIYNASLVTCPIGGADICAVAIRASDIAAELGDGRLLHMVMLGALLEQTGVLPFEVVERAIEEHLPERHRGLLELNRQGGSMPANTDCLCHRFAA